MIAMVAIGHIATHLVRGESVGLAWVGALIAIAPLVSFMSSLVLVKRPRTWRNQHLMLALAVIGTAMSFMSASSPPRVGTRFSSG